MKFKLIPPMFMKASEASQQVLGTTVTLPDDAEAVSPATCEATSACYVTYLRVLPEAFDIRSRRLLCLASEICFVLSIAAETRHATPRDTPRHHPFHRRTIAAETRPCESTLQRLTGA